MTNPLVSIIIPTFNRAHIISETLDSVFNQDYKNWECIMVDDGSSDNTEQVLQNYCKKDNRFKFYKRPSNLPKGGNVCRNLGLEKSKGKYIQWFDSDDVMQPNMLSGRISAFLKTNVDFLVFSIGTIKNGDKNDLPIKQTNATNWEEALEQFLGPEKLPWNLQTTIFKTSFIKGKIEFNENLMRFQDIEYNIKMLVSLKPEFLVVPKQDCYYRLASGNNAKTPQFFINVFNSVPIYYEFLDSILDETMFNKYIQHFQNWIFNLTSLYTNKNVPFKLYLSAIQSARKHAKISLLQYAVLIKLFFLKKYFKTIKGHTKLFNFLKSAYIK